ncbi:MAG: VWA domain-containing protein, partial [Chloroflexaceae bacterium]|nr:VWA domain-containing protein [Chloroflexaceae bacterium]
MNLPIALLFPLGLLALLALPIILWLHLRRQRQRRVIVPSLLLWQALQHQSLAQRRKWLPLTILLLLHLLVAALLGVALAHPQSVAKPPNKNSISCSSSIPPPAWRPATLPTARGSTTPRARAQAIVNALDGDERAALV